jgi:hypothetical protein
MSIEPKRLFFLAKCSKMPCLCNQLRRAVSQSSFSAIRKMLISVEYTDVSDALFNASAILISVLYIKYNANNAESVGHVLVRV